MSANDPWTKKVSVHSFPFLLYIIYMCVYGGGGGGGGQAAILILCHCEMKDKDGILECSKRAFSLLLLSPHDKVRRWVVYWNHQIYMSRVCPEGIFWTTQPFVTKFWWGGVVSCEQNGLLFLRSRTWQGVRIWHQNMTVSIISSELMICLRSS